MTSKPSEVIQDTSRDVVTGHIVDACFGSPEESNLMKIVYVIQPRVGYAKGYETTVSDVGGIIPRVGEYVQFDVLKACIVEVVLHKISSKIIHIACRETE